MGIIETIMPITLILVILITLLSGAIKGAIGFALPLIMVSGIGSVMDPKHALACIIFPAVFTNLLQIFRQGMAPAIEAFRTYWRYIVTVCIAIFITAQFVPNIPTQTFYWILGVPVVFLSLIQLLGVQVSIPAKHHQSSEWLVGGISGTLGGLAGTWGPTTVLYLLAVNTPKSKQIIVQGVVYGSGAIVLLLAHLQSGVLNKETAPLSLMLLPIALIGMWLGFKIQDKLDQALFKKITLIVLVIAGINLLRKGILG